MKVCFLTERMLLGYGVDLVVHKLGEGLSKAGHEVTVCCNISDETFRKAPYKINVVPYRRRLLNYSETERNAFEVTEAALNDQEILIPCTFPYYYVAFKSGKPWLPIDFGVVPPEFYRWRIAHELRYHWRTQYKDYFTHAKTIVCNSEYLKKSLPDGLTARAQRVYHGVDHYPEVFLCDVRRLHELDGKILLYVGRSMDLSPYKNTDALLRIFRLMRKEGYEVHLLLVSTCSIEEQVRLERNGAIVLNGLLTHYMPSAYKCADIYLTATLWEGFDLPLLEASYFGLPVVATDIGAHPEIVRGGSTGFLAKGEGQLAERVRQLLDDEQLAKSLGQNGRSFARENFRWADKVARFETILTETAENWG